MLNIVLFGPPGSGKGTQSSRIAQKYKLVHLSTGELFREECRKGTVVGKVLGRYMEQGALVPDNIVLKQLYKTAIRFIHSPGIIFDGFPRTLVQAQVFDKILEKKKNPLNLVICMVVEEKELIRRMIGRSEDSGRKDDNRETIEKRVEVYHKQTKPLIHYYHNQGKLFRVSGMAPVETVTGRIAKVVDTFIQHRCLWKKVV